MRGLTWAGVGGGRAGVGLTGLGQATLMDLGHGVPGGAPVRLVYDSGLMVT